MENNVMISIRGVQACDGAEDEIIELVTEGNLSREAGGYRLTYQESPLTGLGGTTTTLDVIGDSVTLTRTGDLRSQMVFQRGKKHYSIYETEYGALTVGVAAARVEHELNDQGGEIEIDYAIEVEHAMTASNRFHITVNNLRS